MNDLQISSIIKGILTALGVVLGAGVISEDMLVQLSGAIPIVVAAIIEGVENYKLKRQGIISLNPVVNAAEEMTPKKLVVEEKKEAQLEAKLEAKAKKEVK